MILGTAFLIILYLILRYILAWITYFNNLDTRLGNSTCVGVMTIMLWAREMYLI